MIEAAESARMIARLGLRVGKSMLRRGVPSETIAADPAVVKCVSAVEAAGMVDVRPRAVGVVIAIYERSAVGNIDVAVVNDRVVVPVRFPVMPSPSEPTKETDRIAHAEQNSWCGNK